MMDEAVDGSHRHGWILKDSIPFTEGVIAGDDKGAGFIAVGYELKKHGGFTGAARGIAYVIEDQAGKAIETRESAWQLAFGLGGLEVLNEVGAAGVAAADAELGKAVSDGRTEVGFAGARWPKKEQVGAVFDPSGVTCKRFDAARIEAGNGAKIKSGKGFPRWQLGFVDESLHPAITAFMELFGQQSAQVALGIPAVAHRLLREIFTATGDGGQAEGFGQHG